MSADEGRPTVLVVGIGEVGRYLLEFLTREPRELEIVAADLSLERVEAKVNNAVLGAALHGRYPRVRAVEMDLLDVDRTAEALREIQPDMVVNGAVMQTWHVIRRLPEELYARLSSAGLGAWLPVQVTLPMKLGQAMRQSGITAHYVNTSLSDLTNPVLAAVGVPATIGIGNVANIVSAVRALVARKLEVAIEVVEIKMVAHHIHWVLWREAGYREGAPFFMKVVVAGEDVSERFDHTALMKEAILLYPAGTSFSAVSASSAIQNVLALLSPEPVSLHSPGPNGLPGGYPVKLGTAGAELDLPPEISRDEAVALNEEAQTYDAIRRVDSDGRVHFMPYTIEIMKEVLGFDCASFAPDESLELAREQMARFRELEHRQRGGQAS